MEPKETIIKVGILTISDTRTPSKYNIETFDSSGHNLKELINKCNVIESAKVVEYDCVTDDIDKIQEKMIEWCSYGKVDVLLSTGGTGFSPRDVTPEATLGIIQKLTPGITQAITNESLKITPMAMLSRAVSGIFEKTLIINLPGSKKAATECLRVVAHAIPHAVSLIKGFQEVSKQFHNQLNSQKNNDSKIPECVLKIACRHRTSPFPKISMESALNILKDNFFLQYTENHKIKYPTIWIFSTGDELKNNKHGHPGFIRDTNSVMIQQIVKQEYQGDVFNCGIIRDNWDDLCKQFEKAFNNADIVVTSGGVSMGEKDFIKHVLKEHFKSQIHFGRVDMKPGMPTTFVTLKFKEKKKFVFCLPGNPVSAGVCTHLFLLPFLRAVSGRKSIIHSFKAKLTHSIDKLDIRPEYKRALLKYENGEFSVSCLSNYQQSSRLLSFMGCNCLLQLPSSTKITNVEAGTTMDVILFKNIENTYISSMLKEKNLQVKVYHEQGIINKNNLHLFSNSIKDILIFMVQNEFILQTQNISTSSSIGYALCELVFSLENLPPFPASIKDGYAIKYIDSHSWSQSGNVFKVVQVSVAGTAPKCQGEIHEGECARVSTGAPIPPGANCVVQVEDTSVVSKSSDGMVEMTIAILIEPKSSDNIRKIGSDISKGQHLLDSKTIIGPFEVALLRSVGYEEVCVYKYPTVHIIPYISGFSCRASEVLKNILKLDGFKGNILNHSLCNRLVDFPKQFENVFKSNDIVIICGNIDEAIKLSFDDFWKVETYIHINNNDQKISLGFGIAHVEEKQVVFFHIENCDSDIIYNCTHLFVLPFLRFSSGRKQYISSIKTKSTSSIDLSVAKFEKAELDYENGNFNITCFTLNHQSCLVYLPSSTKEMNMLNVNTELEAIVTENSDSYFINY